MEGDGATEIVDYPGQRCQCHHQVNFCEPSQRTFFSSPVCGWGVMDDPCAASPHTHTNQKEWSQWLRSCFPPWHLGPSLDVWQFVRKKGAPGGGFLGLRAMQPFQKPFYFHTFGFSPFSVVDSHLFRETRRPSTSYTDEDYMLLSFVYFLFFPFLQNAIE